MANEKIVLVEDDFLNRRLTKKILLENGFEVFEAKNAKEATLILNNEAIDLAILDINLGENEENGISIGDQIKNEFKIPFIYLTAYDIQEVINKAIATKPHSYLTKPFKNADLVASVKIAISHATNNFETFPKIWVKDEEYNIELSVNEIDFIESVGNYLLIHTQKKIYKQRSTIKQIILTLPDKLFVQTHRAYIVNKNKIEKFNLQNIIIKDRIIPVTKTYTKVINNLVG